MKISIFDKVNQELELNLPECETMDEYLDAILDKIHPWSEDLYESENYIGTRWLEIREADTYHEAVLHIFNDTGEYMIVVDGNIQKGAWRFMPENNSFILDYMGRSELYDLAFLNPDFFILRKHGDQARKGQKRYFLLGREGNVRGLTWREVMELLFNIYRSSSNFIVLVVVVAVICIAIITWSLLG